MNISLDTLLEAMNKVEASGRKIKVPDGDNGTRIGPLQISEDYFTESMECLNKNGIQMKAPQFKNQWDGCRTWLFSKIIVWAYMNRYCPKAVRNGDWERIARIHNGGPNGYKKRATEGYWAKVKTALENITGERY